MIYIKPIAEAFQRRDSVLGFPPKQRVHAITINPPKEIDMSYPIKAQAGDYIRIDGRVLRVVFVNDTDEQPEYELENGSCIGNRDFCYDDVLLESEVH